MGKIFKLQIKKSFSEVPEKHFIKLPLSTINWNLRIHRDNKNYVFESSEISSLEVGLDLISFLQNHSLITDVDFEKCKKGMEDHFS